MPSKLSHQMKKIFKSHKFITFHDNFISNSNKENYLLLVNYLDNEYKNKLQIEIKNSKIHLLLTDNVGCVIYNSNQNCTFEKYSKGEIMYNDKYQIKSVTEAEKMGKGEVMKTEKEGDNYNHYYYIAKHVESVGGIGITSVSRDGDFPDSWCKILAVC